VIHRDIKPGNIMVDAERGSYLTDFGISKATDSHSGSRWPALSWHRVHESGAVPRRCGGAGVGPVRSGGGRVSPPDGRSVLALSPLEFLAAHSRLIPPPRVQRHRYHGVLAPNARLREARIYEVSPLRCPGCGSEMRILAFITDPDPVAIAAASVRVQSILVLRAIDN
jgi:serine/threonine protein kinase